MVKTFLIFLCCLYTSCLFSQNLAGFEVEHADLSEVIQQLELHSSAVFSYTEDLTSPYKFSLRAGDTSLAHTLDQLFQGTDIDFNIISSEYVILKKATLPTLTLCGSIQSEGGFPLPYTNILIHNSQKGVVADLNGRFEWSAQVSSRDSIKISYLGYQSKILPISHFLDCPTVRLGAEALAFSEVVIKEYITSGIEQSPELDHVVLRPEKITVVPGLTEADVLQMVQILPGVQSIDESSSGLLVRGGTPDQNLILWDDIPIYNSGHFFGMISAFNPYVVDEISVHKSDISAEYGGRVSSVIDIRSMGSIPEYTQASIGLNFTHADASVEIPLTQKSALVLSARKAFTDILESPTYRSLSQKVFQPGKINENEQAISFGEALSFKLGLNFSDYNAKWIWQPNDKNRLSFSAFSLSDKLNYVVDFWGDDFETHDNVEVSNLGGSFKWSRKWDKRFQSTLTTSYTQVENLMQYSSIGYGSQPEGDFSAELFNGIKDFTLKLNNELEVHQSLSLTFGYQWADLAVDRNHRSSIEELEDIEKEASIHSTYLSLSKKLGKKWLFKAGLRTNYTAEFQNIFLAPRISGHYLPNKHWQLKASWGRSYQFISQVLAINDLGLNQEFWDLASEAYHTPVIQSEYLSAGFLFDKAHTQIEMEAYHKRILDLTLFSPLLVESLSLELDEPYLQGLELEEQARGNGSVWGIDLLFKQRWKHYETWLSYTFSRVFYEFDMYNNQEPFPAPHDRPHHLSSVHQFKYKHWNFSISWKLASGVVYTEAEEIFFIEEDAIPLHKFDETNAQRLPTFHRLDASILYRFQSTKNRLSGMVGCSLLNLYNRENLLDRDYFAYYQDTEEEYVLGIGDRPMLGFTPNIVLRLFWK